MKPSKHLNWARRQHHNVLEARVGFQAEAPHTNVRPTDVLFSCSVTKYAQTRPLWRSQPRKPDHMTTRKRKIRHWLTQDEEAELQMDRAGWRKTMSQEDSNSWWERRQKTSQWQTRHGRVNPCGSRGRDLSLETQTGQQPSLQPWPAGLWRPGGVNQAVPANQGVSTRPPVSRLQGSTAGVVVPGVRTLNVAQSSMGTSLTHAPAHLARHTLMIGSNSTFKLWLGVLQIVMSP